MRIRALVAIAGVVAATGTGNAAAAVPRFSVDYTTEHALTAALGRAHGTVVRRVGALHVAEVRPTAGSPVRFAARIACLPGIRGVARLTARAPLAEPGLAGAAGGLPLEWAHGATHEDAVPDAVRQAASAFTIAVVDTGADLAAPDLAAKSPTGFNVRSGTADVSDVVGHGTFVSSIAAGSPTNGEGIAGFGGDAKLLVVKASAAGSFTDLDEAAAIIYAVDHGARIINLSFAGPQTSATERSAIAYATNHGVLLVAAAGNTGASGNPVEYPAALLQPAGPDRLSGSSLAVGASDTAGARAPFSSFGTYLSLLAPGVNVVGAVSAAAPVGVFASAGLPGSSTGRYGYGSGTSFAAPQVAGAAALVWAANPALSATGVATILKETASNSAMWTPERGFGVLDVAAAVALAPSAPTVTVTGVPGRTAVRLTWRGSGVSAYRVLVSVDGGSSHVVGASTTSATTVSVPVLKKHTYVFAIAGLGADGSVIVGSGPYAVTTR